MRRAAPFLLSSALACSSVIDTEPYRSKPPDQITARDGAADAAPSADARAEPDPSRDAAAEAVDAASDAHAADVDAAVAVEVDAAVVVEVDAAIVVEADAGVDAARPVPELQTVAVAAGDMSALLIDADDLPMLFFRGNLREDDDLGMVQCLDPYCERTTMPRSLEVPGDAGRHLRAEYGHDGLPLIAYQQRGYAEAKILRCRSRNCDADMTNAWLLENGTWASEFGSWMSMALTPEGFPVLAYYDAARQDLRTSICQRPDCCEVNPCWNSPEKPVSLVVAGEGEEVGAYGSVAVSQAGLPRFSYRDQRSVALAVCSDRNCQGPIAKHKLDGGEADVGEFTQLVIGADDHPMVFYRDVSHGALKLARCTTPDCESSEVSVLDGGERSDLGQYLSVKLDPRGYPFAAYVDSRAHTLKALSCHDLACRERTVTTVVADSLVGGFTSIAFRKSDGHPVISYQDTSALDAKGLGQVSLAYCKSPTCGP